MMLHKSTVVILSILVAVATALPYRWNADSFAARGQEVAAQATVEPFSCATVTETKGEKSYRVRVCPADPEGISLHAVSAVRINLVKLGVANIWILVAIARSRTPALYTRGSTASVAL